jgi:hypothetical protein
MESIFALQPTKWLHDAIIIWWFGYWCDKTFELLNHNTRQTKPKQNQRSEETLFRYTILLKICNGRKHTRG